MTRRYGWKRDSLDHRDRVLQTALKDGPIAPHSDLRLSGFMPPIYDQLQEGSCTGNSISAGVDFERRRQGEPFMTPSRQFIYWNERNMEGTVPQDAGAMIRDGIKVVASLGVCPESEWPYIDDGQHFILKPSDQCFADALKFRTVQYSRVTQSEYHVRHCLSILQRPVIFGFSVFESFESDEVAKTGIVSMPGPGERPIGGHAVVAVGHDDPSRMFLIRNSWGPDWGQNGYFQMPYDYLLNPNLASDFWTLLLEV